MGIDLIVQSLEPEVIEHLKERAKVNRISLNEECRRVLRAGLGLKPRCRNSALNLPWTAPEKNEIES